MSAILLEINEKVFAHKEVSSLFRVHFERGYWLFCALSVGACLRLNTVSYPDTNASGDNGRSIERDFVARCLSSKLWPAGHPDAVPRLVRSVKQ